MNHKQFPEPFLINAGRKPVPDNLNGSLNFGLLKILILNSANQIFEQIVISEDG
jgi:hypothetical protein